MVDIKLWALVIGAVLLQKVSTEQEELPNILPGSGPSHGSHRDVAPEPIETLRSNYGFPSFQIGNADPPQATKSPELNPIEPLRGNYGFPLFQTVNKDPPLTTKLPESSRRPSVIRWRILLPHPPAYVNAITDPTNSYRSTPHHGRHESTESPEAQGRTLHVSHTRSFRTEERFPDYPGHINSGSNSESVAPSNVTSSAENSGKFFDYYSEDEGIGSDVQDETLTRKQDEDGAHVNNGGSSLAHNHNWKYWSIASKFFVAVTALVTSSVVAKT